MDIIRVHNIKIKITWRYKSSFIGLHLLPFFMDMYNSVTVFKMTNIRTSPLGSWNLQLRRGLHGTLLAQIREAEVRVILPLSEGDVVVGRTRAQQITAVIVQGIKYRCRVAIVQGVGVARAMIFSTQRGPSQGMNVGVAVITDDAGRSRCGRRFGANGTLLALKQSIIGHISSLYTSDPI